MIFRLYEHMKKLSLAAFRLEIIVTPQTCSAGHRSPASKGALLGGRTKTSNLHHRHQDEASPCRKPAHMYYYILFPLKSVGARRPWYACAM